VDKEKVGIDRIASKCKVYAMVALLALVISFVLFVVSFFAMPISFVLFCIFFIAYLFLSFLSFFPRMFKLAKKKFKK